LKIVRFLLQNSADPPLPTRFEALVNDMERLLELCSKVAVEQDPDKITALAIAINTLLDENKPRHTSGEKRALEVN